MQCRANTNPEAYAMVVMVNDTEKRTRKIIILTVTHATMIDTTNRSTIS
jgi:hypothetical protein